MANKERASDRVATYPSDGAELRVLAAKRGKGIKVADVIRELLHKKNGTA